MSKLPMLCSLALVAATYGCALPPPADPSAEREDPVYVTGSNIPKKQRAGATDGVSVMNRDDIERARNAQLPPGQPMR